MRRRFAVQMRADLQADPSRQRLWGKEQILQGHSRCQTTLYLPIAAPISGCPRNNEAAAASAQVSAAACPAPDRLRNHFDVISHSIAIASERLPEFPELRCEVCVLTLLLRFPPDRQGSCQHMPK